MRPTPGSYPLELWYEHTRDFSICLLLVLLDPVFLDMGTHSLVLVQVLVLALTWFW